METPLIKLWKHPASMAQKIGWYVFRQDSETDYSIREIRFFYLENWERIQERVESGEWAKSILEEYVRHGKISKAVLDNQLALLAQATIPLSVNYHPDGYDVTEYGLASLYDSLWYSRFGAVRCPLEICLWRMDMGTGEFGRRTGSL